MGTSTYFVKRSADKPEPPRNNKQAPGVIQNNAVSVSYDSVSGQINQIRNKITSANVQGLFSYIFFSLFEIFIPHVPHEVVKQEFLYYESYQEGDQNSGAYIFRPKSSNTLPTCRTRPTVSVWLALIFITLIHHILILYSSHSFKLFSN